MPRPRFSEMLVNRRRQLGLSVKQASSVLRLKEEVLIAFEEGDFGAMPKSGYAQGMLSSYARYLGMNSREVINQFANDLREWERQTAGGRARRTRARRSKAPTASRARARRWPAGGGSTQSSWSRGSSRPGTRRCAPCSRATSARRTAG